MADLTVEEKAARWDALMSCERIRILGYSKGGPDGRQGEIKHIGIEFWSKYNYEPEWEHDNGERLVEFVEGILRENQCPS